jgi:hypothetical protein
MDINVEHSEPDQPSHKWLGISLPTEWLLTSLLREVNYDSSPCLLISERIIFEGRQVGVVIKL